MAANPSGERVFTDPTYAGLALAAGAAFVGFRDDGQNVLFTLTDVPDDFDEKHRLGKLLVTTKDAEQFIEQVVGIIRTQAKSRQRAKAVANRAAAYPTVPVAVK